MYLSSFEKMIDPILAGILIVLIFVRGVDCRCRCDDFVFDDVVFDDVDEDDMDDEIDILFVSMFDNDGESY